MTKRGILIVIIALLLLLGLAYAAASAVLYNRLSGVQARCGAHPEDVNNTPAAFSRDAFDTSPFFVETFEEVSFPSREDALTISGWFIPAAEVEASETPTIIVVHGVDDCKRRPFVLTAAGMLHRNGFNVLAIDLREHGDSEIEDERTAIGTEEYRDVLGAWDWLVAEKNIAEERVGLMGFSLGAATVTIAAGQEPRITAVWEDSSFADLDELLKSELRRVGAPAFLSKGASIMGKLISGDDINSLGTLDAVLELDGRPYFIVHGGGDERVSARFAADLADAIRSDGGEVEPWILPGTDHIEAIFDAPEEYERRLIEFFEAALQ